MSTIHPIQCTWNIDGTKPGQLIPTVNRVTGGTPLEIDWDADELDPFGHHNNAGGSSVMNGPLNPPTGSGGSYDPQGFFVWGGVELWVTDLWNDGVAPPTEIQCWVSAHEVVGNSAQPEVLFTTMAREAHAPLQHDQNAWLPSGQPRQSYDDPSDPNGHDESVLHHGYTISPFRLPGNCRGRVTVCQFHGDPNVPVIGNPYPGYIRKARIGLCAMVL